VTLLALGLLLAVQAGPGGAAHEEALRLQRAGDCPRAVERYRQFLKLEPKHAGARSNLGACLASLGRYDEAIGEYQAALALADHAAIRRNLALALYKSGRLEEAIAELKLLRHSQPEDVDLALLLADCHFRLDQEKEVIAALEPLAAKHPDNLAIAYLLGTVLVRQGDVKRGQALVDRILQRGDSAEAHLLLGMAQLRGAALEEAEAAFLKAAEMKLDLAAAWSQLGIVRLKRNNSTGAAEALRRALALDANDFDAVFYLGVLVRETGQPAAARPHLEHALRLRPGSYKAQYQVGSLYVQLQEFEKARQILEALVEKAPDFPEAHTALATACLRLGLKEQALRHREIARILLSARRSENAPAPSAADPPEPRLH
jgi:tetratricopeptide (TPR) repeat protein